MNLIEPGTVWGDRVNAIDLRVAKILRFGRTRTNVGVDIYNLFNSERRADLQPGVQPRWTLARADHGDVGAVREGERVDRFLVGACLGNGGDGGNGITRRNGATEELLLEGLQDLRFSDYPFPRM